MAGVSFRLLGGFEARLDPGHALHLPTKKAQALLAYLAVRPGQAHPRDKLAALFWGDTADEQARASLRQTLSLLGKAFAAATPDLLLTVGHTVALNPAAADVDVARVEAAVAKGTPEALEDVAAFYQGDLLEGLTLNEAPFEAWLLTERERLRELALEGLAKLLAHHQGKDGSTERAIQTAIRLLALDPSQEVVHRALMRLYARQGRQAAALRQYQACVAVLLRELGAEPEPETRQLYQEIIRRSDEAPASRTASGKAGRELTRRAPRGARPEAVTTETPLIGRDVELATLRNALAEAGSGHGRAVAVLGEAGVGKSRLLAEVATEARQRGSHVLFGRSYESAQILPFGPWVDAFRSGGLIAEEAMLSGLNPVWRAELARLFPELTGPGLPAPSDDYLRLFESVAYLVAHVAARQPLLLMLEDMHWADEMSLRLLSFLGRRVQAWPVLVVATAREEELADAAALRRALDEFRSENHFGELVLAPLSRPDTSRLVRCLTVAGSEAGTVARLEEQAWAASEGNPFVIVETVRALREGLSLEGPATLSLPRRVRDVIAGRVERLSDRSRQLLSVAAVIGREFDFALLQRASGLTDRDAAGGVEELVRRRMLHGVDESFDFTHDRIREVVYGGLLPPRRKLLHGDVAVALEALTAGSLDPPAAALGLHYRHAEVRDKAAFYLRQAGLTATTRSALPDARAWFEQALGALEALPESPSTLEQAFEIRLELRPVLVILGEPRRALERLREAESLAERLNDDRRRGQVSAFLMHIHSQLAGLDEALVTGTRALEIAKRLGDLRLRILTTTYLEQVNFYRGDYDRVVELATDNLAALPADWVYEYFGMGAPPSVWDRYWLVLSLSELGRFAEAAPHEAEAIRIAEPTHRAFTVGVTYRAAGTRHLLKGDWAKARSWIEHGMTVFRMGNVVLHIPWAVASSAWVLAQLGDASEALNRLREGEQLVERLAARGIVHFRGRDSHVLGRTCLLLGRLDEARRLADRAVEFSSSQLGDAAHALHLLGDIATHPDRFEAESGEAHYREALALAEPRGMRPLVAHCHLGLGKLYGRMSKREQTQEHLGTATAMYAEMDMRFWLEQAEAALRELDCA